MFGKVKNSEIVKAYIKKADESMEAIGYTEHSFAHCSLVAETTGKILLSMGYDEHTAELGRISGYMHDIGNVINRNNHAQSGALIALSILEKMNFEIEDITKIITAIGNHDETCAFPVNEIAAALILADKCDVRRTRVRNKKDVVADIHDRVNFSVKEAKLKINDAKTEIQLRLGIDTTICPVSEYFEIFLERMILCRKAATKLGLVFSLRINGQRLM